MYHAAPRKTTPEHAQNPQFRATLSCSGNSCNALNSLGKLFLHDIFSSRNFLMSYIRVKDIGAAAGNVLTTANSCSVYWAIRARLGSERDCDLYAAALERNRDEFEAMARRLHRGASKRQRTEIARFRSNPPGQGLCGRPVRGSLRRCLAGRANPRNSTAIAAVSRAGGRPLASHPAKPLSRREESSTTFSKTGSAHP